MPIPNDSLTKLLMQDIINANSVKAIKSYFNTLFNRENMVNIYIMGPSFSLTRHHFKERKDSDNTS